MQGQVGDPVPEGGRSSLVVEHPELGQQRVGLGQGGHRRRVGERQPVDGGAPLGHLQHEPGQVDLGDLGVGRPRSAGVLDLRPQAVRHARLGPTGPPRPLLGRGLRRGHRHECGQTGAGIDPGHAGPSGVDDHPHPRHGQARLGDVGGQHHPAPAWRRRGQRGVLLGRGQRTEEGTDVDAVGQAPGGAEVAGDPPDVGRAGDEHEDVAGLLPHRLRHHAGGVGVGSFAVAGRRPAHVDREGPALAGHDRRRAVVVAEEGGQAVGLERRRHGEQPSLGGQRAGIEQEGEGQVGVDVALVDLVEHHQPDALQRGVALQPPHHHALGDHLDARRPADPPLVAGGEADRGADLLAQQRRHPAGRRPCRQPPGFQHHDAATVQPPLVEQAEGDDRGLARARRGLQHGGRPRRQGGPQVVDDLLDRQPVVAPGRGHVVQCGGAPRPRRHPSQVPVTVPVARSMTWVVASTVSTMSSAPIDSR